MTLNLRQIEVFRAVMTTGSISGAAELLLVSQPAVSRLLSNTEQRLGFSLFERTKGRLYATPAAKKLFHEVEDVYNAVSRVNELATDLSRNRSGILNVVCSPSVGQMLVPQAIAQFRERHPGVKVTFHSLAHAYLKDRILHRQADLGVISTPMEHPNLNIENLCQNRMVCILPYNHELARRAILSPQDLRPYPLIGYDKDSPFGVLVSRLYEQHEEPLAPVLEVGSPQNAVPLVQLGAGVALVDEFSVRSWQGASTLVVRPLLDAPVLQIRLVHLRQEPHSKLTHSFINLLRKLIEDQGYPLEPLHKAA